MKKLIFLFLICVSNLSADPLRYNACAATSATRFDYGDPIIPDGTCTVSFWMQACASNRDIAGNSGGETNSIGVEIRINFEETLTGEFGVNAQSDLAAHNWSVESTSLVSTTEWSHLAYTWDGTTGADKAILYFDGVAEDTDTATQVGGETPTYNLSLADDKAGAGNIKGHIQDFRVYDRVLTPVEISILYAAKGKDSIIQNLIFKPANILSQFNDSWEALTCYDTMQNYDSVLINGGAAAPKCNSGIIGKRYAISY